MPHKKKAEAGMIEKAFYALFPGLDKSKKLLDKAGAESKNGKKKKKAPTHNAIIKALPYNSEIRKNYEKKHGKVK